LCARGGIGQVFSGAETRIAVCLPIAPSYGLIPVLRVLRQAIRSPNPTLCRKGKAWDTRRTKAESATPNSEADVRSDRRRQCPSRAIFSGVIRGEPGRRGGSRLRVDHSVRRSVR